MIAYKILTHSGHSTQQTHFKWPLPKDGKPGAWVELRKDETPTLCVRGFHAWLTLEIAQSHAMQTNSSNYCLDEIYEIEIDGELQQDTQKVCGRRARLLRLVIGRDFDWPTFENETDSAFAIAAKAFELKKMYQQHYANGGYFPVVPAFHANNFYDWNSGRCGTCGLNEPFHDETKRRSDFADQFKNFDRWELILMLYEIKKGKKIGV